MEHSKIKLLSYHHGSMIELELLRALSPAELFANLLLSQVVEQFRSHIKQSTYHFTLGCKRSRENCNYIKYAAKNIIKVIV